jgi:hypothetical protein
MINDIDRMDRQERWSPLVSCIGAWENVRIFGNIHSYKATTKHKNPVQPLPRNLPNRLAISLPTGILIGIAINKAIRNE